MRSVLGMALFSVLVMGVKTVDIDMETAGSCSGSNNMSKKRVVSFGMAS